MGTLSRKALLNILDMKIKYRTKYYSHRRKLVNLSHWTREGTIWKKQYMYSMLFSSYYCICMDYSKDLIFMENNFGINF